MSRPRPPILLLALVACGLLAVAAGAATIVVAPDGPLTIQEAIVSAQDGDVIELLDGTFTGPGNRDLHLLGKAITLRSQGGDPTACILDAEGSEFEHHRVFELYEGESLATVIEGLTITGGHHTWGGGMDLDEGYPTVRSCRFVGNKSTGEGGGLVVSGPARIVDCWFEDNQAAAGGGASAAMSGYQTVVLERCTFARNYAELYGGGFRT